MSCSEVSESDQRLIEVLCNSGQTSIKALNLQSNEHWWKDSTIATSLVALIQSQSCLVNLNMSFNSFSSSVTEEIFACLCRSDSLATLEELHLYEAVNFDSDAACMHLATLIDTAPVFKRMDISGRTGGRRVEVEKKGAVPANDDDPANPPK